MIDFKDGSDPQEPASKTCSAPQKSRPAPDSSPFIAGTSISWMSRTTIALSVAVAVLAAMPSMNSKVLAPWQIILLGYSLSLLMVAIGWTSRRHVNMLAEAMLGAGLAGLYFTTYGLFFIDRVRLISTPWVAWPVILSCLAVVVAVIHFRRSQTAANIALLLIFYTIFASCTQSRNIETFYYALFLTGLLSIIMLLFHAFHRWMAFTWFDVVATYAAFLFFFHRNPGDVEMSDQAFFWLSTGILSLCYMTFSFAFIVDAQHPVARRRMLAPMAIFNTAAFTLLTWTTLRNVAPGADTAFRIGLTVALAVLARFAVTSGPPRNLLAQAFLGMTVLAALWTLAGFVSAIHLWMAFAAACLVLALAYLLTGTVLLKALNLIVLATSFSGALFTIRKAGTIEIAGWAVGESWFSAVGTATFWAIAAVLYERLAKVRLSEARRRSNHRFLADTWLDLSGAAAAFWHAAAAALLLTFVVIIEVDHEHLIPFILAAAALAFAALAFVTRVRQFDAGAMSLITGGLIAFCYFLWNDNDFSSLPNFDSYVLAFVVLTFMTAYRFEQLLCKFAGAESWEHHVIAALPYLAGVALSIWAYQTRLSADFVPFAALSLGIIMVSMGALLHLTSLKIAALAALAWACVNFYQVMTPLAEGFPKTLFFFVHVALIAGLLTGERILWLEQSRSEAAIPFNRHARTLIAAGATCTPVLSMYEWAEKDMATLYSLGCTVAFMAMGLICRERRYRWAALLVLCLSALRAFAVDLHTLPVTRVVAIMAALLVVIAALGFGYVLARRRIHTENT